MITFYRRLRASYASAFSPASFSFVPIRLQSQRTTAMAVKGEQQAQAPPVRPQFFRVLLPGFSQRLKIPHLFDKYINVAEIQQKATIVSPLGKPWPVEVHRDTNFFYFGEGWQEFCKAHDLNVGCFVVFRYEGEMVFSVTIFDQTTCMKEYSPARVGNRMDDKSSSSHVGVKPSESPRQHTVLDEQPLAETISSMDCQLMTNLGRTACTEGSRFEIEINAHGRPGEPSLLLPQEFGKCLSEENGTLSEENGTLATIFSPTGKAWRIKIQEDSEGFHFARGWQRFAEAHDLRRGDSLVFKHNGGLLFDVAKVDNSIGKRKCSLGLVRGVANAMIPTVQEEDTEKGVEKPSMPLSGKRVAKAMEPTTGQDRSLKTEEIVEHDWGGEAPDIVNGSARILQFEVVINFSTPYRRYTFEIPAKFAASNGLSSINQLFLRGPDGQLWPIRISHRQWQRHTMAHGGWRDFCIGNNLQDGDICLFQLKGKNELHVKIQRRRHQKSMNVSGGTSRKPERFFCQQSTAELAKSETHHRARQFTCTISRYNHLRGHLNIPGSFLSSVDLFSIHRVRLLDARVQPWPVRLYHWTSKTKHEVRMTSGWKAFCISNNVEVGDKCIFKLASRVKNDVFHVSVIKQKAGVHIRMSGN